MQFKPRHSHSYASKILQNSRGKVNRVAIHITCPTISKQQQVNNLKPLNKTLNIAFFPPHTNIATIRKRYHKGLFTKQTNKKISHLTKLVTSIIHLPVSSFPTQNYIFWVGFFPQDLQSVTTPCLQQQHILPHVLYQKT